MRFLRLHPDLRHLNGVVILIAWAADADDDGNAAVAGRHLARACRILGSADEEMLLLVPKLLHVEADIDRDALDDSDLDRAVNLAATARDALALSGCHPVMAQQLWHTVAMITYAAADRSGDLVLLERSTDDILCVLRANENAHHESYRICVSNAGTIFGSLYRQTSRAEYLHRSVTLSEQTLELFSVDDPERPGTLHNLSVAYGEVYEAENDIAALRDSISRAREAIKLSHNDSASNYYQNLSNQLGALYDATGDVALLQEGIEAATQAVASAGDDSDALTRALGSLAYRYADQYRRTGTRSSLDNALDAARRALSEADDDEGRSHALDILSFRFNDLYLLTGDRRHLDRAIAASDEAVQLRRQGAVSLPNLLTNASQPLSRALLPDKVSSPTWRHRSNAPSGRLIWSSRASHAIRSWWAHWLMRSRPCSPTNATTGHSSRRSTCIARCREQRRHMLRMRSSCPSTRRTATSISPSTPATPARSWPLARFSQRLTSRRLGSSSGSANSARGSPTSSTSRSSPHRREKVRSSRSMPRCSGWQVTRDSFAILAGETEGLIADLAMSYVRAGQVGQAREALERARIWLSRPGDVGESLNPSWSTVWVVADDHGTAVISDDLPEGHMLIDLRRSEIGKGVARLYDSFSDGIGEVFEAADQTCEITSHITRTFPRSDHLLIVPLGMSALLPYAAGRTHDGHYLIEDSTISVTPTLAWALDFGLRPRPVERACRGLRCRREWDRTRPSIRSRPVRPLLSTIHGARQRAHCDGCPCRPARRTVPHALLLPRHLQPPRPTRESPRAR